MADRGPEPFIAFANELADLAAAAVRPHFRRPIPVESKADRTPVTIADRAAEEAMRRRIEARFPAHGIIGEEFGRVREEAEYLWVLDPIDGTKSFISGVPLFGTLIALLRHGRPILGIIDQPINRERWVGGAGRTTLNGAPVRVRACPSLGAATLFSATLDMFQGGEVAAFDRLRAAVRLVRWSADCYAYALLATGFVDLVAEASMKPYDYAALIPVVEGAGGMITDWHGRPLTLESDGRVLAAGDPALHAAAVRLLAI
ncbi:MAG TPA: histidinol-phosphatase [Candidatus Sulfotelmatobacter sp.]|nr:histidinol-phosphatase [Candidatus Sulfotelmatobacter sp.]